MQEVHLWMWRFFGGLLWSEEAEEIAPPRGSSFKNVTPKSHRNSNLFFFAKKLFVFITI